MLIIFEGLDGTGKSTQIRLLAAALEQAGLDVVTSREPTNGIHGKRLRNSTLTGRFSEAEELKCFFQDRQEHVENLIIPCLQKGSIVILDRYYFSMMAYQGGKILAASEIRRLNEIFAPKPDFLFLLDLPVHDAIERIKKRDGVENHFETNESLSRAYEIFSGLDDNFVHRISADMTVEKVHLEVIKKLDQVLFS